ncbi:hypothetical protein [Enterobacter hormaechei]|uniref:hypothetical protein n=1 Tax=Enterobacter hormaechei TaxID=158836 RepID=UPI003D1CD851
MVVTNNGRITLVTSVVATSRLIVIVDFKRNKDGIHSVVERLEYDPNRSRTSRCSVQRWRTPLHPAPKGLKAGDQIQSGVDAAIKAGNTLPMRNIPVGSTVHKRRNETGKAVSWRVPRVLTFRSLRVTVLMSPCVCVLVKCVKSKQTAALLWAKLAMLSICCAFWVKLVLHAAWCSSYRSRYCDEPSRPPTWWW